ncbi:MAG: hypothetical protein LBC77_02710 [Spirochaetaceae bacterium]|jgi:hypothetical protein|nr:hypothetical protein [Spirochaetaceae bacterium]
MKKFAGLLFVFSAALSQLFAVGEKTLSIGGAPGWGAVKTREGVVELSSLRPAPVLILSSSGKKKAEAENDLYLSFDEGDTSRFGDSARNYTVLSGASLQRAPVSWARGGDGAALFTRSRTVARSIGEGDPLLITPQSRTALFSAGRNIGDFSIEFFLYPANMESGEEIFDWTATLRLNSIEQTANQLQSIRAVAAKNRLDWSFTNFFSAPDGKSVKNLSFVSHKALTPGRWSHHIIRFDAATGMIEYLIDGETEAIGYATASGREGGEVWTPVAGERGRFAIGRQFSGMIDELRLFGAFSENENARRYNAAGAYVETEPLDLGGGKNIISKLEFAGGSARLSAKGGVNEYRRDGNMRFSGGEELQFFIRAASTRAALSEADYILCGNGSRLYSVEGRYVQIRADFYPSGDREASPYLEELKLEYLPSGAPKPPRKLRAIAHDGSVELLWQERAGENASGYIVYYGTESGVYFGTDAGRGASPMDVGKKNSVRLDNLKNGVLYFFAVAAYDEGGEIYAGELGNEVSARPLRMLE